MTLTAEPICGCVICGKPRTPQQIRNKTPTCGRVCGMLLRDNNRPAPIQRFEGKISRVQTGCWQWLGATNGRYGEFRDADSRQIGAHRQAWIFYRGQIPDGLCVLHICDNTLCVNPDHLFVGTNLENIKDRTKKNRSAQGGANAKARLTVRQVRAIIADPRTQTLIAAQYGVNQTTISRIKKGVTWRAAHAH